MLTMLCADSDPQRLAQIIEDLQPLKTRLTLLQATSLFQAEQLILQNKQNIALILCAQTFADGNAMSILKRSQSNTMGKIVYATTPCATELIDYINQGHIDYFITLPYQAQELITVIQQQVSRYKINHQQRQLFPKNSIVDTTRLLNKPELSNSSSFKEKFLDYSLYSDSELSHLVIKSLYKVLETGDQYKIRRRYSTNHILTREGEKNCFLWFITKGEVLLKKRNAHGEIQDITIMQAGTMVGGMSFLTGEPAFSTGITLVETEVLKVDNTIFSQIMQSNTALLAPFTNLLLRNFNRRLQHSISTELALQETLESLDLAYNQLIESEKMVVLGQLVTGVAHELNNPVAAILRGSDSLKELIFTLLGCNDNTPFSQLARRTLQQGLSLVPLSTLEIRQRTKQLLPKIKDKKLAKCLINMDLDDQQIPLENNRNLRESILLLDKFYQVGSILRSSNACASRIADLVKSLKHYAAQDSPVSELADIHEGLEETLIIFENKLKHYSVIKEYQQLPKIECHPIELEQVWTNIISNAIDATGDTGMIRISTVYLPYDEAPSIQVIIEDNGPGVPAHNLDKIFELNYTTKREGHFGLGIGLTICTQIIKQHHGSIEIESQLGLFTRFIITLPVFNPNIESERLPLLCS
ncbi:histidine kinase [Psychromonas sp. MB-3u-54]|uniref:ATP-binding protein n=1 Tax=Psychromonas sp. MB-3u-54 TaxID=2058319 RepID=UPI000C34B8BA|nr:ATP-binding protein [Psychromonas sp. MB-3u-54]PKH04204.1 histidine kinase [Psychromonas sp. MB-3u-54]